MSEMTPPTVKTTEGKALAESYVAQELVRSRKVLFGTRIAVVASVTFLGCYMAYLTGGFRENLEPRTAAMITTSMVNQRLEDAEPEFATFIREKVPEVIRQAPDYALARLPEYRASIEDRVEQDLRGHAQSTSAQLTKELGEFLVMHKDAVEAMLTNPDKAGTANAMGAALEDQFRTYLAEQPIAGETIKSRLDKTLKAMDEVEKRSTHLAMNKGLTPTEQKTRRAIANLMRRIDTAKAASPHQILDPAAVKGAAEAITLKAGT